MKAEYQRLAILLKQIHTVDHAGVEEAAQHSDKKPEVFSSSASQESSLNSDRTELPQLPTCKLQFLISASPFLWLYFDKSLFYYVLHQTATENAA